MNDSNILITDIGTSSPEQPVVCTSDRMPCCRNSPQYGEWYFPDGSQVIHISENGVMAFHRNRDNDGHVNLFRVSSDVMSPTGRFCCEIEDNTNTNQTVCVNIGKLHYVITRHSSIIISLQIQSEGEV